MQIAQSARRPGEEGVEELENPFAWNREERLETNLTRQIPDNATEQRFQEQIEEDISHSLPPGCEL